MKAVISTTYSDTYLYFLPITTWCWNKLGVDVICFMPTPKSTTQYKDIVVDNDSRVTLILSTMIKNNLKCKIQRFSAPEHKEATYAQCARLYAASEKNNTGYGNIGRVVNLTDENEILITSDVDMAVFKIPPYNNNITIFGSDLVPKEQFPMCYASGSVNDWRNAMKLHNKSYQECLDDLLGNIECEHMRGNYWGKDQQTLWENTCDNATLISRAKPNTQFADNRVDRDDINWRSYVNDELIDAHLWRDGFTDENHVNIMELMRMKFPDENFAWLDTYRDEYLKLL